MKKVALILVSVFTLISFTNTSEAIVELRAGYGLLTSDPDDVNSVEIKALAGFHADAVVSLPLFPLGFGVRYESLGMKNDANVGAINTEVDIDYERISLIVNKSLLSLVVVNIGLIGTIGISESLESDVTLNGVSQGKSTFDDGMTFTVGAEASAGLGLFSVGAEVGYQLGELETSGGSKFKTDGPYLKAMVGFGF